MKAVLFDFDGVIAETIRYHAQDWALAFKDNGLVLDQSLIYINEGAPAQELVRTLLESCGRAGDDPIAAALIARKDFYFERMDFSHCVYPLFPDILAAAKALSLKTAIVTGASRTNLNCMLTPALAQQFDAIVTGDDTPRGKPSPDPYLAAASQLGIVPTECCVIENGPFGIRAAKSAGMRCVALCTTLAPEYLSQADEIVAGHTELLNNFNVLVT